LDAGTTPALILEPVAAVKCLHRLTVDLVVRGLLRCGSACDAGFRSRSEPIGLRSERIGVKAKRGLQELAEA